MLVIKIPFVVDSLRHMSTTNPSGSTHNHSRRNSTYIIPASIHPSICGSSTRGRRPHLYRDYTGEDLDKVSNTILCCISIIKLHIVYNFQIYSVRCTTCDTYTWRPANQYTVTIVTIRVKVSETLTMQDRQRMGIRQCMLSNGDHLMFVFPL